MESGTNFPVSALADGMGQIARWISMSVLQTHAKMMEFAWIRLGIMAVLVIEVKTIELDSYLNCHSNFPRGMSWMSFYNDVGFTGKSCETKLETCLDNPCLNAALCLVEGGNKVCYCVPDFHGKLCEQRYDECEPPNK